MNNQSDAIRFTVEERVLLHLLDYIYYRLKIEVPKSITQEGISQSIRIKRKHLPRSLKSMKEKNLIQEKIAHVIGKKQRMKTYHLTNNGEAKAHELRDCITNLTINVRDSKDRLKITTIKDIENIVKGLNSLAEIISCIGKDGVIDLRNTVINQTEQEIHFDRLKIYKRALEQAWKDGKMTISERDILLNLRNSLNISKKEHIHIQEQILENIKKINTSEAVEVYNIALEQALADNRISEDERAILERIKRHFNIKDT